MGHLFQWIKFEMASMPCLTCSNRIMEGLFFCSACSLINALMTFMTLWTTVWYSAVMRALYAYILGCALLGAVVDRGADNLPRNAERVVTANMMMLGALIALMISIGRPARPWPWWSALAASCTYSALHLWATKRWWRYHHSRTRRVVGALYYPWYTFALAPTLAAAIPSLLFPIDLWVAHLCLGTTLVGWIVYHVRV